MCQVPGPMCFSILDWLTNHRTCHRESLPIIYVCITAIYYILAFFKQLPSPEIITYCSILSSIMADDPRSSWMSFWPVCYIVYFSRYHQPSVIFFVMFFNLLPGIFFLIFKSSSTHSVCCLMLILITGTCWFKTRSTNVEMHRSGFETMPYHIPSEHSTMVKVWEQLAKLWFHSGTFFCTATKWILCKIIEKFVLT